MFWINKLKYKENKMPKKFEDYDITTKAALEYTSKKIVRKIKPHVDQITKILDEYLVVTKYDNHNKYQIEQAFRVIGKLYGQLYDKCFTNDYLLCDSNEYYSLKESLLSAAQNEIIKKLESCDIFKEKNKK